MKTVLIVEDNQDLRMVLRKRLESAGFSVSCAEGGLSFLGLLRTEPEPDFLILDLVLPERSGVDLLYTMRCKWEKVKVFIYSGHEKYSREAGLADYITGFFLKGEGTEKLIEAIKQEALSAEGEAAGE